MGKERICKCGHDREKHFNKPHRKLSIPSGCIECKCSDYLNRNLPNLFSKIMVILGIGYSGFVVFIISQMFTIKNDKFWNKQADISNGSLFTILACVLLLAVLLVFIPNFIMPYFEEKRRKTYPIE